MFIHDMTESECRHALLHKGIGRLACARNNQPYIVPMYFACDGHHLYSISCMGQKIEWMRENPLVCVEVDQIESSESWQSVIVLGRYEELPDLPQFASARARALQLLQQRGTAWWEPACIGETHREMSHSCLPVAYRIRIDRISGHRATPDKGEGSITKSTTSWAGSALSRV